MIKEFFIFGNLIQVVIHIKCFGYYSIIKRLIENYGIHLLEVNKKQRVILSSSLVRVSIQPHLRS